ncbi:MAG: helix-turn-helix domain-containing protein [Acidimicrobiales bacterium]
MVGTTQLRSVPETATALGVNEQRVRQLVASGQLAATKVGGRWLITTDALAAYSKQGRLSGRPWGERRAWGYLWLALGRDPTWLSAAEASRLRRQLREEGVQPLVTKLRTRATTIELSGHPAAVRRVRADRACVLGGISAASAWKADIHAVDEFTEAYCRPSDTRRLQRSLHLVESASPKVVLHVVSELWPFDPDERVAPAMVTALDLIESSDQRTQRAGRDLLRRSTPTRS